MWIPSPYLKLFLPVLPSGKERVRGCFFFTKKKHPRVIILSHIHPAVGADHLAGDVSRTV